MNSITWLETYLLNYKGAVIIVSHDRYFLDRIATKVIEIDRDKRDIELKLNNRVELTFDLKYNIIDIDFD